LDYRAKLFPAFSLPLFDLQHMDNLFKHFDEFHASRVWA